MKKFITIFTITALSISIFNSCSEEDILDNIKPEIDLATPTDHQEYELGDVINIQAILSDNIELGAYKIEIHSASDGHDHGDGAHAHSSISAASSDDLPGWEFSETGNIAGSKEYILNKFAPIPTGNIKEGHYHLGVMAIDKAGNETQTFIEIVIGEDHHD